MDHTEDLSARILLKHILTTETPRTPITRSSSRAAAAAAGSGTRSSSRLSNKNAGAQTPQDMLRRSLKHKLRESITRKSLPPPKRRTASVVLKRNNTPAAASMLFDEGETPRHILMNILRTEPTRSPVVHEKAATEEPLLTSANSSIAGKRPSIELSGLDLPDLTIGHAVSTVRGLRRKRPRRSMNVTAFEKRLRDEDGEDVEEQHENSVQEQSSLSLSSSSLSLKTPFLDARTEKRGLQRRVSNRRKITEEEFGAAANKTLMGGASGFIAEHGPSDTAFSEGFTLGLSKLSEPDITADIVHCNTALYPQPDAMTSNSSIIATQDKSTVMASQLQRHISEMEQNELEKEKSLYAFPTEEGVVAENQDEEALSGSPRVDGRHESSLTMSKSNKEEGGSESQTSFRGGTAESEEEEDMEKHTEEEEADTETKKAHYPVEESRSHSDAEDLPYSQTHEEEEESEEEVVPDSQAQEEESKDEEDQSESQTQQEEESQTEEDAADSVPEEEEEVGDDETGPEDAAEVDVSDSKPEDEQDGEPSQEEETDEQVSGPLEGNLERIIQRAHRSEGGLEHISRRAYGSEEGLEHISRRAHRSEGGHVFPVTEVEGDLSSAGPSDKMSNVHATINLHSLETESGDSGQLHVEPSDPADLSAHGQTDASLETDPSNDKGNSFHLPDITDETQDDGDANDEPPGDAVAQEEEWENVDDDDDDDEEETEEIPSKTPAFIREKRNLFRPDPMASPTVLKNIQASSNSEAGPAPKPKQVRKQGTRAPRKRGSLPKSYIMGVFKHFAKTKVSADVYPVLQEIMDKFFERMAEDLETFAIHAKRKTIEVEDAELLLRRQGHVNDKVPVEVLIEKYLRMDQRRLLIPIATSGNVVFPKMKR